MPENHAIRPLRSPRLGGVVADLLRRRILDGELGDGDQLPKEDDLRTALGVGKPAIREAMRILEEEGLLTVVRGNRGGAVVHSPNPTTIAYALGLSLTARRVAVSEVAAALRQVEPACAALCAQCQDRQRSIVPELHRVLQAAEEHSQDLVAVTAASREFHEVLVARCGNEPLILLVGALEILWSAHVRISSDGNQRGEGVGAGALSRPLSQEIDPMISLAEHRQIAELIEAGDAEGARLAVAAHLARVQGVPTTANRAGLIDLAALRNALRS